MRECTRIHLALLRIEALRQKPADWQTGIHKAARSLTHAHQRTSALVREMSTAAPIRLEGEGWSRRCTAR